jgi:N-acetylglucosamine kinase-like BadF-type ATPase
VALADPEGTIRNIEEAGPGNPVRVGPAKAMDSLREALKKALASVAKPWNIASCCVGMAGRSHPSAEGVVRAAFSEVAMPERRILCDDGAIALDAAFGEGQGILIMSGTGSGACARGSKGVERVGGWGPIIGDEGSAYAIGLEALRAIVRGEDGRGPKTVLKDRVLATLEHPEVRMLPFLVTQNRVNLPSLFAVVDGAARESDEAAVDILRRAGRELADLGRGAAAKSGVPAGSPVATAGSVLGTSLSLRDLMIDDLMKGPGRYRVGPHVEQPVEGAVKRAVRALSTAPGGLPPQW